MQGISVAPALNDENTRIGMGPATALKENASMPASKQGSALKSTRKAFGNITNTQPREAAQPGTVKRRAFGADITNSALKPATAKKQDASQHKPTSQPTHVPAAESAPQPQPWWATAQPERSAGKTWEQLQADRERKEDEDVEQRVQQLLAGMRDITSRVFQVYVADSDDDDPLPLQNMQYSLPELPQPMHTVPATEGALYSCSEAPLLSLLNDDTPLEHLLPDVPLPEDAIAWLGAAEAQEDAAVVPEAVFVPEQQVSATAAVTHPCAAAEQSDSSYASPKTAAHATSDRTCSSPQEGVGVKQDNLGLKSPDPLPW